MDAKHKQYYDRVATYIPANRLYTDDLHCLAWGTDAGFYRRLPQIVVRSKNEAEVSRLLRDANDMQLPVTFRAAGTSLSGQAITDSILIVAGKNWEEYSVGNNAETITLQPGIIGERVNRILAPYGRIFTPDPASKNSAMVGGIVMNNASGMNCGTHANSDRMLRSLRLVLPDGTVLDTGDAASREAFRASHPQFIAKIEELRKRVIDDEQLSARIRYKYAIKNVTGLNILPFVMYTDPFDIIAHLMVGSEGTLAFASQFTMATGHKHKYSASAMLYFSSMKEACDAVVAMKPGPVFSAEILDKKSLSSVNDTTGEGLTAVLTETKADTKEELYENIEKIKQLIAPFKLYVPANFTDNPAEYSKYWAIRSGIFPSVGGTRKLGTTVIIEDIAFHIEDLTQATADLEQMLLKHGYDDSCIYGHALEGNYHFIIAQSFETDADVKKYQNLMQEIERLVVDKYDGSLKAEHGTGRNMAPFVKHEWGEKAYEIMKEVKQLFDPNNIMNPGVIFNDDPECYIKGFKPMPLTNDHVNKCIECGFCEVNCMSCGFTLSSRQRIVVQREMSRLRSTGEDPERLKRLERQFRYYGNETCAGDGLCSTSCPMKINVGEMIHDLRAEALPEGSLGYNVGDFVARHQAGTFAVLKPLLTAAGTVQSIIGDKAVRSVGKALHSLGLPLWTPSLPTAHYDREIYVSPSDKKMVYFPSCINQTMGYSKGGGKKSDLIDVVVAFMQKSGWEVIFPEHMDTLCCGTIWESKGMMDIADRKTLELEEALLRASQNGKYPVVCDQSPCLHRMRENMHRLHPLELMEFIHDYVAQSLEFKPTTEPIAVHITCSTRKMGIADKVIDLAKRCSQNVLVPEEVGCCGFAGDKGFHNPELNEWGLRNLRKQIEEHGVKRGFSNSRTCEIGLATNAGIPYESLVYLIDECTIPKK
ncbi:MAG: FAD-binding and (Fe-S)-binding domain-containing protein [Muribaculaceae bacterium]